MRVLEHRDDLFLLCAHACCRLCPSRRDLPGFSYPEVHRVSARLIEPFALLRIQVDGGSSQEVALSAWSRRGRLREAREHLTVLEMRNELDLERERLDQEARTRAEIDRRVRAEMRELGTLRSASTLLP